MAGRIRVKLKTNTPESAGSDSISFYHYPLPTQSTNQAQSRAAIASQSAAAVLNAFLSFLLLLILARALGPGEFGRYSALLNAGVVALVVLEGGFATLWYRETVIPSRHARTWQARIPNLAVGQGLAFAAVLAVLPVGKWLNTDRTVWWAVLICMLLVAWLNVFSGHLRGLGRFSKEALWQIGGRLISMLFILAILGAGIRTSEGVFSAWALGSLVLVLVWPGGQPRLPDFGWVLPVRRMALSLLIGNLLFVALLRSDTLLLEVLGRDSIATAQYAAAVRLADGGMLLFTPVLNVLMSRFRRDAKGAKNFNKIVLQACMGAGIFAALGWWIGWVASDAIIAAIYGDAYTESARLLPWVLASLILLLPCQVLSQAAVAINREHRVWLAYGTGLLLTVFALYHWVPIHGGLGAAWAMLLGHGAVCALLSISAFQTQAAPSPQAE